METPQPAALRMPSFLHGPYNSAMRKAKKEGQRCGAQYLKEGSLPPPRELVVLPPGEVVVAHDVVDFDRARPAWRLYLLSEARSGLWEALDYKDMDPVSDAYEAAARETPWGALYFVVSQIAPKSAERTALRLQAMLRFWEPLHSVRYLFSTPHLPMSLEELLTAAVDWAMAAWCPVGEGSVRSRLETAAARMAQATQDDCIEAILREMPRALAYARRLKHRAVLEDPAFLRQHLATLDPVPFERVSGACTADLMAQLYEWDRLLGMQ